MAKLDLKSERSKARTLLVIDNAPIRKKAIHHAEKWIKKIEALEKSALKYHEMDLKLYSDWYNLTLNPFIDKLNIVETEYLKAAQSYNLLVFTASQEDITLPEAFLFLQEEEERYQNCSDDVRSDIDAARAKRLRDLDSAIQKDYDQEQAFDFSSIKEKVQAEFDRIKQKREQNNEEISYYENLSNKELYEIMSHYEQSYLFLMDATLVLLEASRADILRRIWDIAPKKLRVQIDLELRNNYNKSFEEILRAEEEKALAFYTVLGDEKDQDEDEINFGDPDEKEEEFKFESPKSFQKPKPVLEEDRIRTKYLFRKIVRKIHPDHLNPADFENLKTWFDTIWQKVAVAHSQNDHQELTILHHKIMVVLKDFEELTLSDLEDAAKAFEQEYRTISNQIANIKNSPAWNFSKLKSFTKLEKQQSKQFLVRLEELNRKLENLNDQKSQIEHYANLMKNKKENFARPSRREREQERNTIRHGRRRNHSRNRRMKDQLNLF